MSFFHIKESEVIFKGISAWSIYIKVTMEITCHSGSTQKISILPAIPFRGKAFWIKHKQMHWRVHASANCFLSFTLNKLNF